MAKTKEISRISDLIPDANNYNKGTEFGSGLIAKSIQKNGLGRSLLLDKNGKVIAGNKTLEGTVAAGFNDEDIIVVKTDGKKLVVVQRTDLDLDTKRGKEMALADNATAKANLAWDYEAMSADFESVELEAWGVFPDESEGGFGDNSLNSEAQEDDYEVPEVETVKTDIVLGDLFEIGPHRLLCGDSTKAEDVEKLMGGAEPFLMITDPPYGVEYDANWRNESDRANGKAYGARAVGKVENDDRCDWAEAYALSTATVAYVWHAGRHAKTVQQNLEDCGFEMRSQIIWAKSNFAISRGHYHWKHEPCWYAFKKGQSSKFIGDRSQTTLWEIDKPQKSETGHSTQKPIECMAKPIRNHDGDVHDPFLGSGTTMVAAHQLNRKCYGMELSEKYCQVILDRMLKLDPTIEVKKNGQPYKRMAQ